MRFIISFRGCDIGRGRPFAHLTPALHRASPARRNIHRTIRPLNRVDLNHDQRSANLANRCSRNSSHRPTRARAHRHGCRAGFQRLIALRRGCPHHSRVRRTMLLRCPIRHFAAKCMVANRRFVRRSGPQNGLANRDSTLLLPTADARLRSSYHFSRSPTILSTSSRNSVTMARIKSRSPRAVQLRLQLLPLGFPGDRPNRLRFGGLHGRLQILDIVLKNVQTFE